MQFLFSILFKRIEISFILCYIMKEVIEPENYHDDFSFYNINSLIDFVNNNITQLLLFLLVFVIIYIVDHISNFNTMLMVIQEQQSKNQQQKLLKKSKSKSKSKS